MGEVLKWIVIGLAAFGALGIVGIVWQWVEGRVRERRETGLDEYESGAEAARDAAAELDSQFDWWGMTPETLEAHPAFRLGVEALADPETPVSMVVPLTRDADGWVAAMGLAALEERDDVPED